MTTPRLPQIGLIALCLGMAAALAGGSCFQPPPPPAEMALPAPTTYVTRQTVDEQVIEAVLVDLVTGTDEDSQTLRREQGKGWVTFSNKSRDWVGTLRQELTSAASEKWKDLAPPDREAARRAAAMVIDRVENNRPFAPFRPKDPRIALWQDNPASTRPVERPPRFGDPRPINAAPPGFADDGRIAVVTLSFAWSMHSGDATYVLRFDGNKWNVISRHFAYYV